MHKRPALRLVAAVAAGGMICALSAGTGAMAAPAAGTAVSPDAVVSDLGTVMSVSPAGPAAAGGGTSGYAGPAGTAEGATAGGPRTIIGKDSRVRVNPTTTYPARAVGLIKIGGQPACTGWLASKNVVVTAGHCVRGGGKKGTWYKNLTFLAGSNGGNAPYGTCKPEKTAALEGWIAHDNPAYDMGFIVLDCAVGDKTGWFSAWWQHGSLDGRPITVQGYPGDKPQTQWKSADRVDVTGPYRLYYKNDTVEGESGSPVWEYRSRGSKYCTADCVMAVHAYGEGAGTHGDNSGTRITQERYTDIKDIIKNNS
jgi:glutamyl endopeptidase